MLRQTEVHKNKMSNVLKRLQIMIGLWKNLFYDNFDTCTKNKNLQSCEEKHEELNQIWSVDLQRENWV